MSDTEKDAPAARKISIAINPDVPADSIIRDKDKGISTLIVVVPLTMPKLMAIGFLYQVLNNLTTMFAAAEAAAKDKGLVRAGIDDALALGRRLMPGA